MWVKDGVVPATYSVCHHVVIEQTVVYRKDGYEAHQNVTVTVFRHRMECRNRIV